MKNNQFYYLAVHNGNSWDTAQQYMIVAQNWQDAVNSANTVSLVTGKEVRLSETSGYDNQGHYFMNYQINKKEGAIY